MKNIKQLLVAATALLSVGSMASLMQPHVPTSEDAPMRVSAGVISGMLMGVNNEAKDGKTGFGFNSLGVGIGFTHNAGYDFEWGAAIAGSWAAPAGHQSEAAYRIFSKDAEKKQGVRLDVELLARFMPEVADAFRLGGFVTVGYGYNFGGSDDPDIKGMKEATAFGDLAMRVGLATSFGFSDMVSMYFAPAYALTAIRFAKSDKVKEEGAKKAFAEVSNLSGIELPLGFWFGVADNVGLYLEANTRFRNFAKFKDSWQEDVTLGVSFAM